MNFHKTTTGDYINLDLVEIITPDGMVQINNGKMSRQLEEPLPWAPEPELEGIEALKAEVAKEIDAPKKKVTRKKATKKATTKQ